jgi:ketosteroid isomerase-like protein
MSEENVRVLQDAFDAYNRREYDAATALFHPDVEWRFPPKMALDFEHLRGKDAIHGFWRTLDEVFEDFTLAPLEITDAGDDLILAHLRFTGRGRGSGATTDVEWHLVYRFRDGLIWRADYFPTHEQALEAAGLSD